MKKGRGKREKGGATIITALHGPTLKKTEEKVLSAGGGNSFETISRWPEEERE